jgi:hypothetical protein
VASVTDGFWPIHAINIHRPSAMFNTAAIQIKMMTALTPPGRFMVGVDISGLSQPLVDSGKYVALEKNHDRAHVRYRTYLRA